VTGCWAAAAGRSWMVVTRSLVWWSMTRGRRRRVPQYYGDKCLRSRLIPDAQEEAP
jgi:hypothetical protein